MLRRKKYKMPDDVKGTLEAEGLMAVYNSRPAYQQNDYIGWITRVKREETRAKRLKQMITELKKGNVYMKMNWKKSL